MIENNPKLAGQEAANPLYIEGYRFRLYPVHTRFKALAWFVNDALTWDYEMDSPAVVIQAETKDKALESLVHWCKIKGVVIDG